MAFWISLLFSCQKFICGNTVISKSSRENLAIFTCTLHLKISFVWLLYKIIWYIWIRLEWIKYCWISVKKIKKQDLARNTEVWGLLSAASVPHDDPSEITVSRFGALDGQTGAFPHLLHPIPGESTPLVSCDVMNLAHLSNPTHPSCGSRRTCPCHGHSPRSDRLQSFRRRSRRGIEHYTCPPRREDPGIPGTRCWYCL